MCVCVIKLGVSKSCVSKLGLREAAGGGEGGRRECTSKNKNPTKMWRKNKVSKTRLSVRGGNQNCFNIGRATYQGNAATSF